MATATAQAQTTTKLELNPIRPKARPAGKTADASDIGYLVTYRGVAPKDHKLLLHVLDQGRAIDVSSRPSSNLVGPKELPALLEAIASIGFWGRQGRCELGVHDADGNVVHRSAPQFFATSVEPLRAPRWPGMAANAGGPRLVYNPKVGGTHTGRFLWKDDIGGRCYFMYAGKFVTMNIDRGFDCVTYCGSVFGLDARSGAMAGTGADLAQHLGLAACGLEALAGDTMRSQLTAIGAGTYLVWNAGHCVLFHHGVIHEFSEGKGGYVETDVTQWHFGGSPWTAHKSERTFPSNARRYEPQFRLMPGQAIA